MADLGCLKYLFSFDFHLLPVPLGVSPHQFFVQRNDFQCGSGVVRLGRRFMAGLPFEFEEDVALDAPADLRSVKLSEVFASSLLIPPHQSELKMATQTQASYLNYAVHYALDPLTRWTTSYDRASDDVVAYTSGFLKTLPLFMRGRLALPGLAIGYMLDQMHVADSGIEQFVDAS